MLTPSNKLGRRCGARRRRHAVADAAVFVAAILAALVAVAARARALSPASHPTLSPQEPRQARRLLKRLTVNEVPSKYHLMTVGAAASKCPRIVDISYSKEPAADQPLPWDSPTDMIMSAARTFCSARVWYISPTNMSNRPYELDGKPELNKLMSQLDALEGVKKMMSELTKGFLPLLGWTDGTSEASSGGSHRGLFGRFS